MTLQQQQQQQWSHGSVDADSEELLLLIEAAATAAKLLPTTTTNDDCTTQQQQQRYRYNNNSSGCKSRCRSRSILIQQFNSIVIVTIVVVLMMVVVAAQFYTADTTAFVRTTTNRIVPSTDAWVIVVPFTTKLVPNRNRNDYHNRHTTKSTSTSRQQQQQQQHRRRHKWRRYQNQPPNQPLHSTISDADSDEEDTVTSRDRTTEQTRTNGMMTRKSKPKQPTPTTTTTSRFAQAQFQKRSFTKNNNSNNSDNNNNNNNQRPRSIGTNTSPAIPTAVVDARTTTTPTVVDTPASANRNRNANNRQPQPPRLSSNTATARMTPSTTTTNSDRISNSHNMIDRDRMWKRPMAANSNTGSPAPTSSRTTTTTIEDLEQRLMQRYGTDMTRWTSGEYDDDDDDDVEEMEYDDTSITTTSGSSTTTTTTTNTRSPTVFDPWDDAPPLSSSSSATGRTISINAATQLTTNGIGSTNDGYDIDNMARVNQQYPPYEQRETPALTTQLKATKVSPLSAFGKRSTGSTSSSANTNRIIDSESNRPLPKQQQRKIDLSHLITREPAGGRGTNLVPQTGIGTRGSTSTTTTKLPLRNDDNNGSTEKAATTAAVAVQRSSTRPILDSTGAPMLLTIAQAQRFFDQQKSSFGTVTGNMESSEQANEDDDEKIVAPITWQELGITNPTLLLNLMRMNCDSPLPAQRTSCPNIVSGTNDVIIGTYTGSGKTLAVLVPIIQRILQQRDQEENVLDQKRGYIKLIIVAPGRELASQIATVTRELIQSIDLTCMLAIGGTTFTRNLEQVRKRKPDILIGTPGRLAELFVGTGGVDSSSSSSSKRGGRVPINNVQAIVLDEFDALLSYSPHADPVNALMEYMKRNRRNEVQTIMCSATASDMMIQQRKTVVLEEKYLRPGYVFALADVDDVLVTALNNNDETDSIRNVTRTTRVSRTVMHGVVHVPHKRFALDSLRRILHTEPIPQQILIFVADSRKVGIVVDKLADFGIIAAPLHGGMDSEKTDRAEVSKALREGYVGIVVATEMAARGLDAPLLTHVINMDLPTDSSHYAHRAGRCGRGGRPGVVINLTTSPQERGVPIKLADQLGVKMYTIEVKNAKLNVIDPQSQILDGT